MRQTSSFLQQSISIYTLSRLATAVYITLVVSVGIDRSFFVSVWPFLLGVYIGRCRREESVWRRRGIAPAGLLLLDDDDDKSEGFIIGRPVFLLLCVPRFFAADSLLGVFFSFSFTVLFLLLLRSIRVSGAGGGARGCHHLFLLLSSSFCSVHSWRGEKGF